MTDPIPIALESARVVAFGHAKDDVVRAAQRWVDTFAALRDPEEVLAVLGTLNEALDRLTALGWVPGPERVGTALAGSGEAGKAMTEVINLRDRQPPRFEHEFDCQGCGRSVLAFVHFGHRDYCLMCQELGPEMSKALQDRGESVPPVGTGDGG